MILSIESSCDDSSIALTRIQDCQLLWHKKLSQEFIHSNYGGVVPEIASRLHAKDLPRILKSCFETFDKKNIKAVAITTEPGLSVTLIEGLMMAKTLSLELQIPLIKVNHLKGHIFSLFINQPSFIFPLSVLLVSGGHTQLIQVESFEKMFIVAQSIDDSFGESFDKVAKMLSLPYPGGPEIQKLSQECTLPLLSLPIPLKNHHNIAFSFSGLKNAIRLQIEKMQQDSHHLFSPSQIAKSFQATACAHISQQTERFFKKFKSTKHFAVVGGASANLHLREKLQLLCKKYQKDLLLAPLEFCSDNAAMIGRYAREKYLRNSFDDPLTLQCNPKSSAQEFMVIDT